MPRRAAALLLLAALAGCSQSAPVHELVELGAEGALLPMHRVADGAVHFFTVRVAGRNVSFLVRTDRAGELHAHLDACYACYRYRRGFIVEGSDLVCIACRYRYPIGDELWDYIGACAPITVHARPEGANLVIPRRVLERAARYF